MRHERRRHGCHGSLAFTLVELLVVIGLIAVLIALLLPVLRAAREASRTAHCLSNLRQVGFAVQMYAHDNHGYVVPGFYRGSMDGYNQPGGVMWAGILIHGRYVQADAGPDGASVWDGGTHLAGPPGYWHSTVFHCPSGRAEAPGGLLTAPLSPTDPAGAVMGGRVDERTREFARTSYAINCTPFLFPFGTQPFRMLPEWHPDGREDWRLVKLSQCRDASRLVMVFDGLLVLQDFDPSYVNARHNGQAVTNLLTADGHAESRQTASLVTRQNTFVVRDDVRWHIDQAWSNE